MTDADVQVGSLDYRDENFVELVVGYLEGGLADSQRERLKAFLAEDAGNRDAFVTLCFQASLLTTCADIGAAEDEPSPVAGPARPAVAGPRGLDFLGDTWNGTVRYFSQGGPLVSLMYLVTILLFGFGLLAGSLLLVRPNTELTERSGPPPAMVPVGVITRMLDCRWADPRSNASCGSVVALGAKFDLLAGLLEITYNNGEKVAIRGRATYEVDSPNSGFLALGNLAARSDQRSDVGKWRPQAAQSSPKSKVGSNSAPPPPNLQTPVFAPLFTIRTSTIIVTDRGAMFGVIVDPSGVNQANVLHGNVELRFVNDAGAHPQVVPLGDYDWARVEDLGATRFASVIRCPIAPRPPAGSAPVPAAATETGSGSASRAEGSLVTRGIPAIAVLDKASRGMLWTCGDVFPLSLKAMVPGTAVLHVSFIAHNYVKAIRFNGKSLPAPECTDPNTSDQFGEFSVAEGLVEGQNRWEIDVVETNPSDTASSPLTILQMEIGGRVDLLSGAKRAAPATAPPRGRSRQEKRQDAVKQ